MHIGCPTEVKAQEYRVGLTPYAAREAVSPGRKVGQPDNRDSHFWFARYWAEVLAASDDADIAAEFAPVAKARADGEAAIVAELAAVRGKPADIGGYYKADPVKLAAVMRPSATLNAIFG